MRTMARRAHKESAPDTQGGANVSPLPPDPPEDTVLKALLDVTKAEIDTEFKISERYDSKARTFFGFAGGLFGITQAFVLRSDFTTLSDGRENTLKWIIIASCIGFLGALLGVVGSTLQSPDRNFDAMRIFSMARSKTQLVEVVQEYSVLLGARREANHQRLTRLHLCQVACALSLAATAIEFVVATIYFI
jgi:hypothetical protein